MDELIKRSDVVKLLEKMCLANVSVNGTNLVDAIKDIPPVPVNDINTITDELSKVMGSTSGYEKGFHDALEEVRNYGRPIKRYLVY